MPRSGAEAQNEETSEDRDLVRAEGVDLGYGPVPVLRSVRLHLRTGEVCGIRGPNGAGKSSFLKACLGLLRPSSGTLRVLDGEPGKRGFRAVLGRIGYVPQGKPPGALRVTVREVVGMGLYGRAGVGRPLRAEHREAVETALEAAGLADLSETPVQDLSGGQYQRSSLARALAMDPAVYFLDEPSTHLDSRGRRDVADLIGRIASRRSAGMLMVSHDPDLLALCDRVFEFDGGRVRELCASPGTGRAAGGNPE